MVVAGIDCGYARPGLAIVSFKDPKNVESSTILHISTFETKRNSTSKRTEDDVRRIQEAVKWMSGHLDEFKPDVIVVELPLSGARSASAIRAMALASGYTIGLLSIRPEKIYYVTPYDTKKACAGHIHAEKDSMIHAADIAWKDKVQWPLRKRGGRLAEDQAEAIADALCAILTWSKVLA